ncbi:hypothetical protein WI41_20415 [Burkholderia latens]|uniref:Glycosyltransferase subfamily 4-like N-terminal domain-containing protein n=1 Tax=Burkholderia latens TaxID=488446 RepID=A0AAP1C150_9BURK|nr:glycosyltransferase [Burkholderia latens]KVA04468.1 hypothetical protein WI41_20415 [Burkholderia latens]
MKICLCANRFPPNVVGGAEIVVRDLAVALRDRGHDVSILTLSDARTSKRRVFDGLPVNAMPNLNVYNQFAPGPRHWLGKALFAAVDIFNPLVFLCAWRELKSLGAEVLCTNNIKGIGPAIWLAARVLRIPVVHVMHDYWLICPASTRFANGRACDGACGACRRLSAPKARLSRMVGHAVAVSDFVMARHREQRFFPGAMQTVIRNPVAPIGAGHATEPARPRTPFRVGFIGRIDATKGIREFFASVAYASRIAPAIEVHVAGRDPDGMLPALMREYPGLSVVAHGFVSAPDFYRSVDLVAVTSMWDEPFGVVAIEPWAFFKPTVAFASGGLTEVFAELPELLVARGDCDALGALIGRLATDEAWYLQVARRCHAQREAFGQARQVGQFEQVLQAAIAGRNENGCVTRKREAQRDA